MPGEIVSIDGSSLTISAFDGSEVVVTVSDSTQFSVTEERSVSDIEVGDTVRANGELTDDVLSATSITIGDGGSGIRPQQ